MGQHFAEGRSRDGNRRIRVVVIDDEYGARLQVELALLGSGDAEVVGEASNGMRGAEIVEELQPDVVVLDLSMPVMDGFEALPLLHRVAPDATILVRSSHGDPQSVERALRLGAKRFLPKFMAPEDLHAAILEAGTPRLPSTLRDIVDSTRCAHGHRTATLQAAGLRRPVRH